jgi:hypothetical protein
MDEADHVNTAVILLRAICRQPWWRDDGSWVFELAGAQVTLHSQSDGGLSLTCLVFCNTDPDARAEAEIVSECVAQYAEAAGISYTQTQVAHPDDGEDSITPADRLLRRLLLVMYCPDTLESKFTTHETLNALLTASAEALIGSANGRPSALVSLTDQFCGALRLAVQTVGTPAGSRGQH